MSAEWNTERVLALAPDPASAKAGRGLASAKAWTNLGRGDGIIWGECQGSGKDPYQTKVDPEGPAFSCSCPSRKFPCKHALGLMLVWTSTPGAIAEGAAPAWVVSWMEGRARKAEAKKEKSERGPVAVDPVARARRESARSEKVAAGLADLSLWLADLLRQGFTALGVKSGDLWDVQARRMIDAQAPGVARKLRQIDEMAFAGDGWQSALLDRLARIHLLIEGFQRLEGLPPDVAEDVRTVIGFPADFDAVRSSPRLRDRWQVLGHAFGVEEKVVVRRTWLLGRDTGRPALLLDFAAGARPLDPGPAPGTVIDAELAFFPGTLPLRALLIERFGDPDDLKSIAGGMTIPAAFHSFGTALATFPWLELYPVVLADIVLQERDGSWSVRDATGAVVSLSNRFSRGWHVLAMSGGKPFTMAGEFDGATLNAMGGCVDGQFLPLGTLGNEPVPLWPGPATVITPLMVEATASAVVGVDRKAPPTFPEGDPIGNALKGLAGRAAPIRLLDVGAAASLYGRAGRLPSIDPSPAPLPCPPETQPECDAAPARRLRAMLGGEQARVLPEWLERLAASGRCLPRDAIVDVLNLHENQHRPVDFLSKCLGVRGRWLAAQNPLWSVLAGGGLGEADDPAIVWETGHRSERLTALRSLRETDPGRARELLAETFASEPAGDRADFLNELRHGLSHQDEPFLEAALDDRSKDVRHRSAQLLMALPESRLTHRMVERARRLLSWDAGRVNPGPLVVTPPTECDRTMVRDGVRPNAPPGSKMGDRAAWLRDIVAAVPPMAFTEMLGASALQIVQANCGGDWEELLRDAWVESTIRHHDAEWAEALVGGDPPKLSLINPAYQRDLFECLPMDRRNACFLRLIHSTPGPCLLSKHPASAFLGSLGRPIDVAIAREILSHARMMVEDEWVEFSAPARRSALLTHKGDALDLKYHDTGVSVMMTRLGDLLPFHLIADVSAGLELAHDGGPPLFYASAYQRMANRLIFRRDMHREFTP